MALYHKITVVDASGGTNSDPIKLNPRARPFNVGLAFKFTEGASGGGASTFTVQMALDDERATAQASWTWFDHTQMAAMTANETGNLAFPVAAIRLISSGDGDDTGELFIIQAGG